MCSKLKYFVLALFLDAVASTPYNIPRINGNYNPEAALSLKNEDEVQRRNEEGYIPRSLPSYMSPVPTAADSEIGEEILRQTKNLRDPRSLNYNSNEMEYSGINEQLPSVAQSTRSYANPSSTSNDNKVLTHLLRLNRPLVDNVVDTSARVDNRVLPNQIYGERISHLPLYENVRSKALSHVQSSNNEPLKIQSAPEQRIAFQPSISPTVPNLDAYHPAIPVRNFNIDREWSTIAKEQPKLPDFIAERVRHPVDYQLREINGQQVHKPFYPQLPGMGQQYNIQKIISDQRIQNVLSSTKHTKRYLVIHPNGTVEHVDSLAPIAARHPNYVLVNAGHVVPAKNPKTDESIDKSNVQVPMPTLEPITSSKEPVDNAPQLPEPVIKNEEAVINGQASSPESPSIAEAAPSPESPVIPEPVVISSSTSAAIILSSTTPTSEPKLETVEEVEKLEINEKREPAAPEKSLEHEEKSDIKASALKTEAGIIEESDENTANVVESSSISPVAISTALVTENDAPAVTSVLANEEDNKVDYSSPVVTENTPESEGILTPLSTQNIEDSEDAPADEINELDSLRSRRAGKPTVYYTSDPDFWTKVTDGKDSNFIYFFQVKSSPRVDTDRQRTIYPDGTVLEELTETVWDGEGGAPKVTKSSKFIHPDDL